MKKFAVFGNPIDHSVSPRLHNYAIDILNLDAYYGRICLKDGFLLKEKIDNLQLNGANITIPHKEIAFQICDVLDDYAKKIKSVNTIVKKHDKLYGYNTDAPGFLKSIKDFKNVNSALIIGAGGTAKALYHALSSKDIKVDILNRSDKRANEFDKSSFFTWENFEPKKYDLIVNSTSAGLKDDEFPAPKELLDQLFKSTNFAFDVIYNKETPFIKLAKEFDIKYKDGKDMLIYQAVLALNLFYDLNLNEEKIETAMKKAISL